jgi:AcrR family transcriptional regulator
MQAMNATRDRIVTATTELFRRRGYNGTSLKQITAAADATTGSLYHFWPGGKDELTREVLATSGAAYGELFDVMVTDSADPGRAIADFFEEGAQLMESTGFIDPCPIGGVAREVASTDEGLRTTADGVFGGWIETVANFLERSGLADTVARELASTLISTIEGGFVLARTSRDGAAFRAAGRHMQMLVDAALTGAEPAR